MSSPITKARRSKAKDARQVPAADGPCTRNKRKARAAKDWECVRIGGPFDGCVFHRAATKELAETWAEKQARSYASGTARFEVRLRYNDQVQR